MCQSKTITQDNIYVVRQFVYIHKAAEISLFTRKNARYVNTVNSYFSQNSKNNTKL